MRKRFFTALLPAAALFASEVAGRAQDGEARLVDRLDTVVASSVITGQQIEISAARGDETLQMQFRDRPTEFILQQMEELRRSIRTNLIDNEVVLHEFKNLQKTRGAKVSESIIDEQIRLIIREKFADKRVDFVKDLRNSGMTLEQYRQQERDKIILFQMRYQFVPEPIISPRKVENYYTQNQNKYKLPDRVKFRLITLDRTITDTEGQTRRRAGEILSQVKGGAEFAEMAKSYSDGPERKDGGLFDWQDVSAINQALVPELAKLKPGEASEVIETPGAYFIVRLEERQTAHVRPMTEVREEIERDLVQQERQRALDKWHSRLRSKTYVQSFP